MLGHILLLAGLLAVGTPVLPLDTLNLEGMEPLPADSVSLPSNGSTARSGVSVALGQGYSGWKVSGLSIHGLPGDVRSELHHGLALAGQTRWLILRRHSVFSAQALASDVDRARLFLARNGYPAATVRPRFEPNVGRHVLAIAFDIVPGPRQLVSANRTEAVPPALEPRARRLLRLQRNEPFSDSRTEQRIARLLSLLQESGRAKARVTTQLRPVDSTHVEVVFLVEAGPVYRFAELKLDGAGPDLVNTVRHTVDIARGELFSPNHLKRGEEGLRTLDLFRQVEVTTSDAQGDSLDVLVHVAPRAARTLDIGVGYYTDDQGQIAGEWKHRNLFGGGRGASLGASASRYLQRASVTAWRPVLFESRTRGSVGLNVRRESEELYTLRSAEAEIAASYQQSPQTTYRPAITASLIRVDSALPIDSVFESPPRTLFTAGLRWTHSALNNPLDPRRGRYAWAYGEVGLPDFSARHEYVLAEAEGSVFVPLSRRTLVAGRLHAGTALGVGNSLGLLPNKRFYSGGAGSMRGYQRRKLGPLDPEFRPIGGVALLESSLEYRFPLLGNLRGATFVDAGQAWQRRNDFLSRLAVAVGPGVIVSTPIGLARLDVGFLVTPPGPDQPRQVFQLQVGHGF